MVGRVKAGDRLFTLDDRPFRASIARAKAVLSEAGSYLALALTLSEAQPVPVEEFEHERTRLASASVCVAQACVDGALANFEETFLTALEEAETALTFYAAEKERYAALVASADAAAEAAEIARTRYRVGSANFLSVLDAERTLIETRTALARSEAARASAEINVFMAMGGGWTGSP